MSWQNRFRSIDGVLRGVHTRKEDLAQGRIDAPTRPLVHAALALGGVYGVFMGLFALGHAAGPNLPQFLATVVKVPMLFLLTLAVTFPSLYVVSALFDTSLRSAQTLRLLLISILITMALLASFGPVTGFFTLSTDSYPFMVLLNVVLFAISGVVGLAFLRKALDHVFGAESPPVAPPTPTAQSGQEAPRPAPARAARPQARIFRVWMLIYAVVGAQMAWILRPFIGAPNLPFSFFRPRGSNFFQAVIDSVHSLLR